MERQRHDAIVVGGGLAGLRAARDLHDAGRRVVLVEARDRLGGRGYTRPFVGGGPAVEMGGTWFTPEQLAVPAELARYGVGTRTFDPPRCVRWRTGGALRDGLPVGFDEIGALERALVAVATDAAAAGAGTLPGDTASLSCTAYIERLGVPPATAEFLAAWWVMIGGTHPDRGAIIDALQAIANHGGATGLLTTLRYAPIEGWSELATRMGAALDVRLGAAATAIEQDADGVVVRLACGGALAAARCIVALPVNVLGRVAFTPPLPPATAEAVGTNAGRALKVWWTARGVPAGSIAAGAGSGLHWLYGDRDLGDGTVLGLGFGYEDAGFDPGDADAVGRALRVFWPGAELVAHDHHDWNGDVHSLGTWPTATVGKAHLLVHDRFPPHGRIAFCGADIAPHDAGWYEGALLSGAEAAALTQAALA